MARLLPSGRMILVLDVLAVLWVAAWIFMGVRVHDEVQGLQSLSDTIIRTGQSIEDVGGVLRSINVPFVGDQLQRAGEEVSGVGADTQASGRQAAESAERLGMLLGLSVALIPSSSLFLFYFPARIAHARERRALRQLTLQAREDPELEHFLARRALMGMSYHRLAGMGGKPWRESTDDGRLTAAEREEIGVSGETHP
ncbi:MAG TPA: hypothetical protein VGW11_11670 [Solirubrobacteraceae bacterium]|nr:hypothetical protein [Solirubrobacteraceae bacterium]